MIRERSVVVVCLVNPREKYWGRLQALTGAGVFVRGIDLGQVAEWGREVARGEVFLGLANLFFPLSRVERIYLDEPVGAVPAVREELSAITGRDADDLLGPDGSGEPGGPDDAP